MPAFRVNILKSYGSLLGLIGICIVLGFLSDYFLTISNLTNVIRQVSINAILATGMTLVIITGGIDLSVGSLVAFTGCSALMAMGLPGSDFIGILARSSCRRCRWRSQRYPRIVWTGSSVYCDPGHAHHGARGGSGDDFRTTDRTVLRIVPGFGRRVPRSNSGAYSYYGSWCFWLVISF